jgi:hypothetical protein
MPLNPAHQSAQVVDQGSRLVARRAAQVRSNATQGRRANEQLVRLQAAHPTAAQHDFPNDVRCCIQLACIAGAFLFDRYLFAPVIEDLTKGSIDPSSLPTALFVVPAALVLVEMAIGIMRHRAIDHVYGTRHLKATALGLLGVCLALVMPCLSAATQLAEYSALIHPDKADLLHLILRTACLAIVSLALHLTLVFGDIPEAMAYVGARLYYGHLNRRIHRANDARDRSVAATRETFNQYERARQRHNGDYPHLAREQGPFDTETVAIINGPDRNGPTPVPTRAPSGHTPEPPPIAQPAREPGLHSNESEVPSL